MSAPVGVRFTQRAACARLGVSLEGSRGWAWCSVNTECQRRSSAQAWQTWTLADVPALSEEGAPRGDGARVAAAGKGIECHDDGDSLRAPLLLCGHRRYRSI